MAYGYRSYVPSELLGGWLWLAVIKQAKLMKYIVTNLNSSITNIIRSNTVHVCTCTSTLSFELYSLDDNYVYASHDHVSQDSIPSVHLSRSEVICKKTEKFTISSRMILKIVLALETI